jgi:hypothetical protein
VRPRRAVHDAVDLRLTFDVEAALARFGMRATASPRRVDRSAVVRVETDKGIVALRDARTDDRVGRDPSTHRREENAAALFIVESVLAQAGVNVPSVIPTTAGGSHAIVRSLMSDDPAVVRAHEWRDARHSLANPSPSSSLEAMAGHLGTSLAKVHNVKVPVFEDGKVVGTLRHAFRHGDAGVSNVVWGIDDVSLLDWECAGASRGSGRPEVREFAVSCGWLVGERASSFIDGVMRAYGSALPVERARLRDFVPIVTPAMASALKIAPDLLVALSDRSLAHDR